MLSHTDVQRIYDAANVQVTHPLRTLYSLCLRPEMFGVQLSSWAPLKDVHLTVAVLTQMHCEEVGMDFDARRAFRRRIDATKDKTPYTSAFAYLQHVQQVYADEFRAVKAWLEEKEETP